ncbi:hypothetical protein LCGC14_0359020 [marine sediment metagenome]|uniref:Uncharacterized protein n=1 Tax=marine sediment metagenome TaxID=412755 RepID=A0A0F9TRP7_9ZZZZ
MESWQASLDSVITDERDPSVVGPQKEKRCESCDELVYEVFACDSCDFYGCRDCMTMNSEGELSCPECLT